MWYAADRISAGHPPQGWQKQAFAGVLSSDYFYPAMLRAAIVLAGRGVLDLPRAWELISTNPAAAAGLTDRGAIAEGLRADVVLVDPAVPRIVATIAGGLIAYVTAEGAARLLIGNLPLMFSVSVVRPPSRRGG